MNGYSSGTRINPIMAPIAQVLSDRQNREVPTFCASRYGKALPARASVPPPLSQHGAAIAVVGNAEFGVRRCIYCHGTGWSRAQQHPTLPGGRIHQPPRNRFEVWNPRARRNSREAGDGAFKRTYIAGAYPNGPAVLVPWVRDAPPLVRQTAMPQFPISYQEAVHIAAYLYTPKQ